jgi:putative transposase
MNILDELAHFINQTKDAREIKRALAVKMKLQGKHYREIKQLLGVSHQFISKWKNCAIFEGVENLRIKYQGRKSYLTTEKKQQVIQWLRDQEYLRLSDLRLHLQQEYNLIFESEQSYYSLFKEAGISWKKTQKKNPAKDDELVKEKQK